MAVIFAACNEWPETVVVIALIAGLTIGWCALMWLLASDPPQRGPAPPRDEPKADR